MGFRPHQLTRCSEDITGRIRLGVIEHAQQCIGHGRPLPFATTSRFARSCSGLDPFFGLLVLRGPVDIAEDGQQGVELGLGQTGEGFPLTIVSDLDLHRWAPSMVFLEYSLPDSLLGNNSSVSDWSAWLSPPQPPWPA